MSQSAELGRLHWQCRRGMLELDEILTRYLDNRYRRAPAIEQELFVELLKQDDTELEQWLIAGKFSLDSPFAELIRLIRGI